MPMGSCFYSEEKAAFQLSRFLAIPSSPKFKNSFKKVVVLSILSATPAIKVKSWTFLSMFKESASALKIESTTTFRGGILELWRKRGGQKPTFPTS
jgi:hypothetical protein